MTQESTKFKKYAWKQVFTILCIGGIILEAFFLPKIFEILRQKGLAGRYNSILRSRLMLSTSRDTNHSLEIRDDGFMSAVYYANWSPYSSRTHFPHDIDYRQISHVYYAFFVVDPKSGECYSSDPWADSQMDVYKQMTFSSKELRFPQEKDPKITAQNSSAQAQLPMGCLGELFYLKYTDFMISKGGPPKVNNFKTVMSVGGWSNRDAFKSLVDDKHKLEKFVTSCVDNMFKYGFDGIDIDWEFPKNDSKEPQVYLEMMRLLRGKLDELEKSIFGPSQKHSDHFILTTAIPADPLNLEHLPLGHVNQFVDYFNLMAYDFSGSWSERTAYHSNLFDAAHEHKRDGVDHSHNLNADNAVKMLINKFQITSKKVVLGMPAYGRGFRKIRLAEKEAYNGFGNGAMVINRQYSGIKGSNNGEKGISSYTMLPPVGYMEFFDSTAVSAFCIKPVPFGRKTSVFVYDNPDSMTRKAQYVLKNELAGGFWWESSGEPYNNPRRSLTRTFTQEVGVLNKQDPTIYSSPRVAQYYLARYPHGFLSCILSSETRSLQHPEAN
ncbi:LADA_0B03554g1_1 [Lachancea dasiensis]|uniref:chitinase n=1 Tax=Lachancea dasiensis TaxID=1072105 RepID=A0A1G4ISQ4_9SACH|nr:LADA_0B03554g1_1 [Lachancea dasiensis]